MYMQTISKLNKQICSLALIVFLICDVTTIEDSSNVDSKGPRTSNVTKDGQIQKTSFGSLQPSYRDTPSSVFAKTKDSAFLPCSVANLGEKTVTWMRQKDLHILTAGILTYSADERFKVLHREGTEEWTLQIKFATKNDSGIYQCHINTDPKISRQVQLLVQDQVQLDQSWLLESPQLSTNSSSGIMIEGPTERHIQSGSVLALTCVIHHSPERAPQNVLWFHGTTVVDYDSPRGGISVQTEKYKRKTVSKVILSNVKSSDTGQYSCNPSDINPTFIYVHVQHGHLDAALQQDVYNSSVIIHQSMSLTLFIIITGVLIVL